MVHFQLFLVICVSVNYFLEHIGSVVDAALAELLVSIADFFQGFVVRLVVLAKQLTDDGQLVKSDGKLYLWIFHRIPLLGVRQLLACQSGGVFDRSPHFRITVGEATVLAVLAVPCLLPVLAHHGFIVSGHFRIVKRSREQLGEFVSRDYRRVRWKRLGD